jgi:hypothetical protein
MENEVSAKWLEAQFPELALIADPTAPTTAELRFLLDRDPRRGLAKGGEGQTPTAETTRRYWTAVRNEFHKLLCTNDASYSELRKLITERGHATDAALLSAITAAVAAAVGATIAALVPLVAVCLYAVAKVGALAYCSLKSSA